LKTRTAQLMRGPRVRFFQIIPACRPTHRRGPSSMLWNTTCTRCNLVYTCSIVLTQKARISRAYSFWFFLHRHQIVLFFTLELE
jgi:hypothetical protein